MDYATQVEPLFDEYKCTVCHYWGSDIGWASTGRRNNGLNLTAGNSYGCMVNQPTYLAPDVPPRWRVLPFEPDSSFLIEKLYGPGKGGMQMPWGKGPLPSNVLLLIKKWVEEGALESL